MSSAADNWRAPSERAALRFPRPGWLPLPSCNLYEEPVRALCVPAPAEYTRRPMGARRNSRQSSPGANAALPPLLLAPKKARRRKGSFALIDGATIALPATTEGIDAALWLEAQKVRDTILRRTGIRLSLVREYPSAAGTDRAAIRCRYDKKAALAPRADTAGDAYRLRITPKGVDLSAPGPNGIRHGLQTLGQLAAANTKLPCATIDDQPDFRDRGLMVDISRGKVPTRETLEQIVDLCSKLRLNVLMLYVEHTFDFQRHPEIGEGASPLSAETVLALDTYSKDRGVELVPCLQSLGHMERILSLDRYAKLAESERRWSLSPAVPGSYALLDDLYDEFLPLFSSSRLNANCDEPFDLGTGRAAKLAERVGRGGVFAKHVERLRKMAGTRGKQLMIWADFALANPKQIGNLDRDVVLLDWWYEADFDADRIARLRRKGFEVWGCPGTSSWNCLFPRVDNAEGNVARWAEAGRAHGAKGLLNTDWGDFGHYNALGVSLQGYAYGAQQAWSGDPDRKRFDRAFDREIFGRELDEGAGAPIAALYRKLGAIHEAGFQIFNGSALQYLYFDPIGRSFFLGHVRKSALDRSAQKLDRVIEEIESLRPGNAADDFARRAIEEIEWAAQATRLSVSKGLLALEFNAWRSDPTQLTAAARRRLATQLDRRAKEQEQQLRAFERLWMARNTRSDLALNRRRIRKSIAGLRRAANQLRANRPPRPAKPSELTLNNVYNEVRGATLR